MIHGKLTDDARDELVYDVKTALAITHEANDGYTLPTLAVSVFAEIRRLRTTSRAAFGSKSAPSLPEENV